MVAGSLVPLRVVAQKAKVTPTPRPVVMAQAPASVVPESGNPTSDDTPQVTIREVIPAPSAEQTVVAKPPQKSPRKALRTADHSRRLAHTALSVPDVPQAPDVPVAPPAPTPRPAAAVPPVPAVPPLPAVSPVPDAPFDDGTWSPVEQRQEQAQQKRDLALAQAEQRRGQAEWRRELARTRAEQQREFAAGRREWAAQVREQLRLHPPTVDAEAIQRSVQEALRGLPQEMTRPDGTVRGVWFPGGDYVTVDPHGEHIHIDDKNHHVTVDGTKIIVEDEHGKRIVIDGVPGAVGNNRTQKRSSEHMRHSHLATVGVLLSLLPRAVQAQGSLSPPTVTAPNLPATTVGRPAPETRSGAAPHTSPERPQVVQTPPTLGVLSESIASPAVPPAWSRLTVPVAITADPPRIDGRLDDACWKTATHAAGFYPLVTSTPIAPADQTEVWVCADKTHLYVAFHCLDSQPGHIHASETVRDSGGVFNDDFVGVDIDSQHSRHGFSSFFANARGTQTEQMEGGTASNITWAGDWKAAAQRTPDGWACEMSIPFALLRYPRGANTFGLDFFRSLSRNSTTQNWPYLPPQGTGGSGEAQYMHEFTGIAPPFIAPRPVFLPYTLATGGVGNSARAGMDIKYPLTTTLTGVATLFPDFQTIEQDVTNINFSYTEKLLTDRRPFFAEGAGYFPNQDMFYSRRIGQIDGGVKVAGKQDNTTIGLLSTYAHGTWARTPPC